MCGWEDRALQECNPSAQAPVDCGSIPFRRRRQAAPENALRGVLGQATAQSDKLIFQHA